MRKNYLIALLVLFAFQNTSAFGSIPPAKKDTSQHTPIIFSVGCGFIYTSLNFFKNYQEDTYTRGYGFRALMQLNNTFRICISRDEVKSFDVPPVWLHVKNTVYDLDLHLICHFRNSKNTIYVIFGGSAQYWDGFYTGINDYNAWKLNIPKNTQYKSISYGATVGVGTEIILYGPLSLYGEFRFRVSKTDLGAGLNDVLYGAGLKLNLPHRKSKKQGHHHSILKFHDKYHWF
ncbi:MAG: hypothetical protein ACXVPN_04625 [Bacteroidia bacterium]